MGCGASKGSEEKSNTTQKGKDVNIEFKNTHVYELD